MNPNKAYAEESKPEDEKKISIIYEPITKNPIKYRVPGTFCSRYAVLNAKSFGFNYQNHNAWNLRYLNGETVSAESRSKLIDLIYDGKLKPGVIVAFENPKSKYRKRKDLTKEKVKYTHVASFVGFCEGELIFDHKVGKSIRRETLTEILENGMTPYEIILPKNF